MKYLIIIVLLFSTSLCFAVSPKVLVKKDTKQIIAWGYTEFSPASDEQVIDNVKLKNGERVEEGLVYKNGEVQKDSKFKKQPNKNELELRVEELEKKMKNL